MDARLQRLVAGCLVASFVGTVAPRAYADPSPEDVAQAAALFKEGKALAQVSKVGPACDKFAESQRLDPHLGTLIYLATCHELLGKTASAWVEFTRAANLAARTNEPAREQLARSHAEALESHLSRIAIRVRVQVPDMKIELNGHPREFESLSDPFPLDPGEYTIRVSAPGHLDWVRTVTLPTGPTTMTVDVPPLSAIPNAVASSPARPPVPLPAPPPPRDAAPAEKDVAPQPESSSKTTRTVGFVIGAFGLASLGAGTGFGLAAFALKHRADSGECNGLACNAQGLADHKNAGTYATLSTVAFGVGLAALAAGTFLVLTSRSHPRATTARPFLRVQVGSALGVSGGATW